MKERQFMKYGTYLRERGIIAAVFIWLLFSIETFLLTIGGSTWLAVYVAVSMVSGYIMITYTEFRYQKRKLEELYFMMEKLEKKYLLPEMMPKFGRQEEEIWQEILHSMKKSAAQWVAHHKKGAKEYKEYIELWIHEVKVPIAAVKMIVTNHGKNLPAGMQEAIDQIDNYTQQALFYARSNDVEKDYLIRELCLSDVAEEVILSKKKNLIGKHTSVELQNLNITVYSDSKWLFFIMSQIIDNSMKYTGDEPLRLKMYGQEEKDYVLLHIKDNGIGIPADELKNACKKGFTGSNGRRYRKSTGIGLYLCDKLCKRLGHSIYIESEDGHGCHVTLQFPKASFSNLTKV